jgi:hypothetical protein
LRDLIIKFSTEFAPRQIIAIHDKVKLSHKT